MLNKEDEGGENETVTCNLNYEKSMNENFRNHNSSISKPVTICKIHIHPLKDFTNYH